MLNRKFVLVICLIVVFNALIFTKANMLKSEIAQRIHIKTIRRNVNQKQSLKISSYDFSLLDRSLKLLSVSSFNVKSGIKGNYTIFFSVSFEEVKSALQVVDAVFSDITVKEIIISLDNDDVSKVGVCLKGERM